MKIKKLFFLLLVTLSMISCSSDDSVIPNTSGVLEGVWEMTSIDYYGDTITTYGGVTTTSDFVGRGYDFEFYARFAEELTAYSTDGRYMEERTTTVSGVDTVENYAVYDFYGGSWSRDGNNLAITDGDGTSTFTIEVLDDTMLKIKGTIIKNVSDEGYDKKTTKTVTIIYKRANEVTS